MVTNYGPCGCCSGACIKCTGDFLDFAWNVSVNTLIDGNTYAITGCEFVVNVNSNFTVWKKSVPTGGPTVSVCFDTHNFTTDDITTSTTAICVTTGASLILTNEGTHSFNGYSPNVQDLLSAVGSPTRPPQCCYSQGPYKYLIEVSGIENGTCDSCTDMNGTWRVFEKQGSVSSSDWSISCDKLCVEQPIEDNLNCRDFDSGIKISNDDGTYPINIQVSVDGIEPYGCGLNCLRGNRDNALQAHRESTASCTWRSWIQSDINCTGKYPPDANGFRPELLDQMYFHMHRAAFPSSGWNMTLTASDKVGDATHPFAPHVSYIMTGHIPYTGQSCLDALNETTFNYYDNLKEHSIGSGENNDCQITGISISILAL